MGDEEEDLYSSSPSVGRRNGIGDGEGTPLQTPRKTPTRGGGGGGGGGGGASSGMSPGLVGDLFNSSEKYPPEVFDKISFNPERDDSKIVRFNRSNGLTAATVPRLIIQLTRHDLLDYGFMTDFFLSYRVFMSSDEILECLISRLIWAINFHYQRAESASASASASASDGQFTVETGKDIAIRVFVVLRHWILNFFPDDFLVSFRLRSKFSSMINKLYSWNLVQEEVHFKRIIEQLKKAWIRVCCMYWQLGTPLISENFDVTLPIFPGGTYGQVNMGKRRAGGKETVQRTSSSAGIPNDLLAPARRRSILLSFYKGPIKPILSNGQLKDLQTNGSLINGGITLSSDVEVKSIKPPTPVRVLQVSKLQSIPPPNYKGGRNLKSMIDGWKQPKVNKLLAKFSSIMSIAKPRDYEYTPLEGMIESDEEDDIVRIDILSARVIEELDLFIKMKFSENTTTTSIHRKSKLHRLSTTSESPTKKQKVDNKTSIDLYEEDEVLQPKKPEPSRTSMIDNLRIQDRLINPTASFLSSTNDDYEFSDALSSLTSSGREDSLYSFASYDSANSTGTAVKNKLDNDNGSTRKLRRWGNHENLRDITNFPDLNDASRSIRSVGSINLKSIPSIPSTRSNLTSMPSDLASIPSITNNQVTSKTSDKMVLPYSGVDLEVAAQLAAIPDDTPEDDEIAAALLKLEGKYVKRPRVEAAEESDYFVDNQPHPLPTSHSNLLSHSESADSVTKISVQYTSNHNSNLFKAAFESKLDIAGLRNKTPSPALSTPTKNNSSGKTLLQSPVPSTRSRSAQDPLSIVNIITHGNHTPFILNFGSNVLCDQLTLIERDALSEIDWKYLVELKWDRKLVPIQSWLEFLIERDSKGVELVISRFNLMVNWIKSEILLSRQLDERVQTISRFIHIAHHARNMQNYTTVMQIVLALQSVIISKLKTTWANVPENDNELFRQLTDLTSPFKNFGKLRTELNELSPNKGCIPFVGMYLSDLTFNSERPTFINEMINFEKFQTSSSIVKSLLQCIEWSTNYKIKVDKELLAKCLYIQSLTVEEMDICFDYLRDP